MNWLMILLSVFLPIVQPVVQTGAAKLQAKLQPQQQVQQQQQPHIVFHNGRWWKYEGGQWYVWGPTAPTIPSS